MQRSVSAVIMKKRRKRHAINSIMNTEAPSRTFKQRRIINTVGTSQDIGAAQIESVRKRSKH
jgi:hypothetical protein